MVDELAGKIPKHAEFWWMGVSNPTGREYREEEVLFLAGFVNLPEANCLKSSSAPAMFEAPGVCLLTLLPMLAVGAVLVLEKRDQPDSLKYRKGRYIIVCNSCK